ncbi:MAG: hypothetical protein QOD37_376, partial [Gaiellales bacterium]|nr:hypothetical protein [Gaiellales bacterium]
GRATSLASSKIPTLYSGDAGVVKIEPKLRFG